MRIAIPKSFKLANRTWQVVYDDMPDDYGQTDADNAIIRIRPGLSVALEQHTFLHELVHAIAAAMGWTALDKDEGRVDALGGMLHQFLSTRKGKLHAEN